MADPQLTVRFDRLGREVARLKSYRIDADYLTSTDAFEFVLYEEDRSLAQNLEMQPIELLLSGTSVSMAQQLIGRIDATEVGNDGGAVTCRGRDQVADLVECHIDPAFKITKDLNLGTAILNACVPVGITVVSTDGDLALRNIRTGKTPTGGGAGKDFKAVKLDAIKPNPGQGIYEFCNRLAARNGATIQPGETRNKLYLSEPDYQQQAQYEIRRSSDRIQGAANNIISASATRDYSKFPTFAHFVNKSTSGGKKSAQKAIALTIAEMLGRAAAFAEEPSIIGSTELLDTISASAVVERRKSDAGPLETGQLYRLLSQVDNEAKNADQLLRLATRAMSERLKDTLVYNIKLKGFEDPASGALYGVNTVITVADEITGVNEDLWIAQRTFEYSGSSGATTSLKCWRKGALIL